MAVHVSDFARALDSGRLIVTAEFLPPRGSDPDAVARSAAALPETLDAVIVPDNPYEILSSALSAALLVQRTGRARAVMTMTTRDRNRLALMSEALGAAALGVPAILCVTGNHQSLGICPSAASANDLDSIQCVRMLKGMILHGSSPDGSRIEPRPELHVGAVVEPGLRPMELNLLRMRKKIAAGADFLMTGPVFDLETFRVWIGAVRAAGFDRRVPIIPAVLPLASAAEARKLRDRGLYGPVPVDAVSRLERAGDPGEAGLDMASHLAAELKEMPGVRGIHILGSGCAPRIGDLIERAGIGARDLQAVL